MKKLHSKKAITILTVLFCVSLLLLLSVQHGLFFLTTVVLLGLLIYALVQKRKLRGYQIFISYRRDGGDSIAGRLADRLRMKGYKVFFDIESMNSGVFNDQIFKAIDESKDFLLVLQPGSLDRCVDANDWVRKEIEYALQKQKNVIPIWTRGFEFPENIPESMETLRHMEGVALSNEYFDAFIERIERFLSCKKKVRKLSGKIKR